MIAAVVSNKIGFDFVYASGYWMTASAHGLPDAGIATYTEMLGRVATLVRTVNAGVIADADTGYGGLLNVHHTVRGYEHAGVMAIQMEDQEFPKKCGHTPFKRVVPLRDMVDKVKVACAARRSPETLIIARTDARQTDGFEGAFASWGREDSDLLIRLMRSGIRRKDGRMATGVLHLWHPEADRSQLPDNERRLDNIRSSDRIRAERGLSALRA